MIQSLTALTGLAETAFVAGFAVFLRVGAAMSMLPAFGERSIPMRVRLALGIAFTLIVTPAVVARLPGLTATDLAGRFLLIETVIGFALGGMLRLFVIALQLAGAMAAQTISLAQIFGGGATDPQPTIGHIMVMAGLTLAVILGLHVKIAEYLVFSYELLPAGQFPDAADLAAWGVERTARAFALGFALAMPFVITSLIYNLTLGVINRAMPQLMVAFVGAPAITLGGLAILALSLPLALQVWMQALDGYMANPVAATR
ncbi:flagellar biosynthesis protein FliR [Rhodobacteraceae bacterium THAF1]|uniref:flagellar biosynthetic protein FliR n=1 Tax=Palleronia sp. THAF1 TaxID=2587842 RepID=UPI000F40CA6F|nr:flagellar biosynthetic protein FliR [Palleronia sp. THAF1]QFU10280.1 flagellar biosynthesis protein FliR [Palleronia sp. THAF1]VDC16815.1 flagellar biosynthesis protein FliR [Rhodobacteraceae bacterium THAF1]